MKIIGYILVSMILISSSATLFAQDDDNRQILLDDTRPIGDKFMCETNKCKIMHLTKYSLFRGIGLKEQDILKSCNGKSLSNNQDLEFIFQTINEQKKLNLVIDRNGNEMTFYFPEEENVKVSPKSSSPKNSHKKIKTK